MFSAWLGYPLVKTLLYNPAILDTAKISVLLRDLGRIEAFEARLSSANYLLGATFFFSATMNYLLARWIVTSPAGSAAFNEELGRMALLSYPVIALPTMVVTVIALWLLFQGIEKLTGLDMEELIVDRPGEGRAKP